MTSINSSYTNQYYQLASQQQNAQTSSPAITQPQTLADVLAASDAATTDTSNSAYLLDLSPEAQAYMNSATGITAPTSTSSSSSSTATFTLSNAQQTKLNDILDKYKTLPATQDNYDKMQDDLKTAGLGPDQLKAEDQINTFNSTSILMDELSGTAPSIDTTQATTSSDENTKASNYMQSILTTWQSMTSANASTDSSGDTTATAGA